MNRVLMADLIAIYVAQCGLGVCGEGENGD